MVRIINLVPAYNKVYNSQKEVFKDWDDGSDFLIQGSSRFVNKFDLKDYDTYDSCIINVKYKNQIAMVMR